MERNFSAESYINFSLYIISQSASNGLLIILSIQLGSLADIRCTRTPLEKSWIANGWMDYPNSNLKLYIITQS